MAAWLSDLRGRAVYVKIPKRGEKRGGLVELASANAAEFLERKRAAEQREARARMDALAELSIHLRLPSRRAALNATTYRLFRN